MSFQFMNLHYDAEKKVPKLECFFKWEKNLLKKLRDEGNLNKDVLIFFMFLLEGRDDFLD